MPHNAQQRLDREEKRSIIQESAKQARDKKRPTLETKFDQVRSDIAKYATFGKKSDSFALIKPKAAYYSLRTRP